MARSSVKIPPDELGELSQENKTWFDAYENHAKAPKTKEYRVKVRQFLEYKKHNQKSLPSFEQADVSNFIEMLEHAGYKGGGIDPYISAISKYAEILRQEYPETFHPSFLNDISKSRKNQASESPGEVLTQEQISLIKKFTFEQGDLFEKYIFEKLFYGGVQLEELQNMGINDFHEDIDFIYKARQYFKKITRHLTKREKYRKMPNINSEHFKQSHQAYFFLCPTCHERIENIAKNWILLRTEFDDEYRLVHTLCREKQR